MLWFSLWLTVLSLGQVTMNEWNSPWIGIPMQILAVVMILKMIIKETVIKEIKKRNKSKDNSVTDADIKP